MTSMLERCARAVAKANGDNFADAFTSKTRWVAKRGESGGRLRDVNEPFQSDYMDMARAVLTTLRDQPSEGMLEAGREHGWGIPADCYMADVTAIFAAMLTAALEE